MRGAAAERDGALRAIERHARRFRGLARRDGEEDLRLLLQYTLCTGRSDVREMTERLGKALGSKVRRAMATTGERLIAQGKNEGKAEGKAEGRRELLVELLEARFGRLPATQRRRVTAATDAQLRRWSARLLSAERLVDVLGPARAARRSR